MALLTLLPLLGYALFFHLQFKKVISVSLFFSITFIITTLFSFGMFSLLQFGANLLFSLGTLLLLYILYRDRKTVIGQLSRPPLVIFIVFSVIAFFLFKDAYLFFWDEYSHWGPFIKEMFYTHHFYDASSVAAHLNYPPGISIWDYFVLLHTDYQEGVLYFAYFMLLFSSTLMMYEKIKWQQWYWLLFVFSVQMLLFASFGHWFSNIYVDHVIGALFTGLVLSYLSDRYSPLELLLFAFPLITIVLVKEIGLYFGFAAVGLYALLHFLSIKSNNISIFQTLKIQKKNFAFLFILLAIIVLMLKVWSLHQESKGIKGEKQSITGIVSSVLSDKSVLPEEIEKKVKENFWNVVFHQQLHKEKLSLDYNEFYIALMPQYKKIIKLTTVGILIFFTMLIFIVLKLTKSLDKKREIALIGGYLAIISVIYFFILYMSYLVAFGNDAVRIPSYVRYANMAVLPLLFVAFSFFLPFYQQQNSTTGQKNNGSNSSLLLAGGVLTLTILGLITQPYFKPLYSQLDNPFRAEGSPIISQIVSSIPAGSKLLIVFPVKNSGVIPYILRYSMIPLHATVSNDDFSAQSSEQMESIFSNYEYIWFFSFNREIVYKNRYFLRAKTPDRPYTLYKVINNQEKLEFKPIL
ncbi:hypothetical protein [Sulfurovum sp.]|uniref:hypothetical protein n=1 Tax=Sulfurovum sp. TaxID=1969726 RepID=UPI003563638F